jgi:hypothetical protein
MRTASVAARRAISVALLAATLRPLGGPQGGTLGAQQVADTDFKVWIPVPAYPAGNGPLVLLDEMHHNFHTLDGRYLVFGRVLSQDGYRVQGTRELFSRASLGKASVLVIANALNPVNAKEWKLPTPSAFAPDEIAAVRNWVRAGGSLLLIADHMPFPGAAHDLAEVFGIHMLNGFAYDSTRKISKFQFNRSNGSLGSHAVTAGRTPTERVDSVVAFTGQAFRVDAPGTPLMTLAKGTIVLEPSVAWQFDANTPAQPGAGLLQGAVVPFGKGRVAVFGEAAMFSAQVTGAQRTPMGINDPAAPQNAQFLLNVMHWLTGLLGR